MVVTRGATMSGWSKEEKDGNSTQVLSDGREHATGSASPMVVTRNAAMWGWSKEEGEGQQQHVGAPDGREHAIGDASPMVVTRDVATSG